MAINVADNFSYLGGKPLDARVKYDTVANMVAVPAANLYDGCLAYVTGTKKNYQYDSSNDTDPTLGKWRELQTGGGSGEDPNAYHTTDTAETTLADSDKFPFYDISATATRHSTWSNIKAKLKTYFDTLYNKVTAGTGLSLSSNTMSIKQFASGDMDDVIPELPSIGAKYHTYSTEEQVVDRWIDGKLVYEKVIQGNIISTSSVSQTFLEVGANVNEYIFVDGYATLSSKSTIRITPYLSSNLSTFCQVLAITNSASSNANKIRIDCTMTSLNGLKATVIVRYTKV